MNSTTGSETESTPETVTFGRTLVDGEPIDDGLVFSTDSPTVELLETATTPMFSNPLLGEYAAGLVTPDETDGEYTRGLGIFPPGADGPAEHYHPSYDETFEVVEGEFSIEVDGESQLVSAGESVTVEAGIPHTFSNESDTYASCIIEARPAARLSEVVHLLFGLAHDGKLAESGQPSFFQAMVMAEEFSDDTVFTSPPPAVLKVLATIFAPIGRLMGYQAEYQKYNDDDFWKTHVEQPPER